MKIVGLKKSHCVCMCNDNLSIENVILQILHETKYKNKLSRKIISPFPVKTIKSLEQYRQEMIKEKTRCLEADSFVN